jgi:hypothetical protein
MPAAPSLLQSRTWRCRHQFDGAFDIAFSGWFGRKPTRVMLVPCDLNAVVRCEIPQPTAACRVASAGRAICAGPADVGRIGMIHAEPQDLQAARLLRRSLGVEAEHCALETMLRAFACGEAEAGRRWANVIVLLGAPGLDDVPLGQAMMVGDQDQTASEFVTSIHTQRRTWPDA